MILERRIGCRGNGKASSCSLILIGVLSSLLAGCGSSGRSSGSGGSSTGAGDGSAGNDASGAGSGGDVATGGGGGGANATGGTTATTGSLASGGLTGTGGISGIGGVMAIDGGVASGGVAATGGLTKAGGAPGSGGGAATDGGVGSGGVAPGGGSTGAGGITGSGGLTSADGSTGGGAVGTGGGTGGRGGAKVPGLALFAGVPSGKGSVDGTGPAARFHALFGVAVDGAGNLFVADSNNQAIRKVTPAGVVTTFAGTLGQSGSAEGTGAAARFSLPSGLAMDGAGNLFVADTANHSIRKLTPAGEVTTFAGFLGSSGRTDGTGAAARFLSPRGVAVDGAGNLFVADTGNHTIRKITPAGEVTTLAGKAGSSGAADRTGTAASFNGPYGVAVDGSGNVYVADTGNHTIRKITPAGAVSTLAGAAGSRGRDDGTGTAARFYSPSGVLVDGTGNVLVADTYNSSIRTITPAGVVTTLAVTDGTGAPAHFDSPYGVAVDGTGNLFVADIDAIRRVTPASVVTTLAGTGGEYGRADGTGAAARFSGPSGVAVDGTGNIFVADSGNNVIRKITPASLVTTLATPVGLDGGADTTNFFAPQGVAVDGAGNVFLADTVNDTIREITSAGMVTTLAGTALSTGSADGTGAAAGFNWPRGLALDGAGNLFVADCTNNTIRKITPDFAVTTLAGKAGSDGSADGTGSAARFYHPSGVAVDGARNVFVADTENHTIRKITPAGAVTTVAGAAGSAGAVDGTGAAARFHTPTSVAVDGAGNLFVADTANNAIRKITASGVVTTVVGVAAPRSAGNFPGPLPASIVSPVGVAIDPLSGNLYIALANAVMVAVLSD